MAILIGGVSTSSAQTLTGRISGTVRDIQGGVLPGATVALVGPRGVVDVTTDENGSYSFPAIDPGTYDLAASLDGFQPHRRIGLTVSVALQLTIDFSLAPALTETVEVVERPAVVDIESSSTNHRLSQDVLFGAPLQRFSPLLLNALPGVNNASALGGGEGTANALRVDGVDVRDPVDSTWLFSVNYNLIDQVQMHGPGAPAEYGGYTGIVVDTITKSGGNRFEALLDATYSNRRMASGNVSNEVAALNPALRQTDAILRLLDGNGLLSGPLIRNKLFFLGAVEREGRLVDPAGPRTHLDIEDWRVDAKVTWQRTAGEQLSVQLHHTRGRAAGAQPNTIPRPLTTDELAGRSHGHGPLWSVRWRRAFGSGTLFEARYLGYTASFEFEPNVVAPGHFDLTTGLYSVSAGYRSRYDRSRHEAYASLTQYARGLLGAHRFRFGVQIGRGRTRDRFAYIDDVSFLDEDGAAALAYTEGSDIPAHMNVSAGYAEHSWELSDRFRVNVGARVDWNHGGSPARLVYKTTTVAPRVALAFDLRGDRKTVLRASYGRYAEALLGTYFLRAIPGNLDTVFYDATGTELVEIDRISAARPYPIDSGIRQPRMDEIVGTFEHALSANTRLSLSAVWRRNGDFVDSLYPAARFEPVQVQNALTGEPLTLYRWVNRAQSIETPLITNVQGFTYRDPSGGVIGRVDAFRSYEGLAAVLTRHLTAGWLAQTSYFLGRARGRVDNDYGGNVGFSSRFETPTAALVFADGRLTNDVTHEFKVIAWGELPRVQIGIGTFIRAFSGQTYTPVQQVAGGVLNTPGPTTVRVEPRGNRRLPWQSTIDVRIEKAFRTSTPGQGRLGLFADIHNVLNRGAALAVQNRVPSVRIFGVDTPIPFGAPTVLQPPRQLIAGVRWSH